MRTYSTRKKSNSSRKVLREVNNRASIYSLLSENLKNRLIKFESFEKNLSILKIRRIYPRALTVQSNHPWRYSKSRVRVTSC